MPVEAITGSIDALAALITKAIPSDEERLQRLKINHPWLYARAKKHILKMAYRWLKQHKQADVKDIEAYVKLISNDPEDRKNLLELLNDNVTSKTK